MRNMRRFGGVALAVALAATGTGGAQAIGARAGRTDTTGCAQGSVGAAAVALHGAGTQVESVDDVGGLRSAKVHVPEIVMPGVERRLVQVDGGWCDAASAFNVAWGPTRARDAVATAKAYVAVAAAPFFDGITVREAERTGVGSGPAVVSLVTHARTNGVVAEWTVTVDGEGVRRATWTATDFAVAPFEARWEGLTALPGAGRTFVRGDGGLLAEVDPVEAIATASSTSTRGPAGVETASSLQLSDGFVVDFRNSETSYGVDLGTDTGVAAVDYLRLMRSATELNYETFLGWGLRRGWPGRGVVRIDDAISAYCMACVAYSPQFNVHMNSQMAPAMRALGYTYPDDDLFMTDVLGHEIFHNFQLAHGGDGLNSLGGAYIEGLARAQETMHGYSHISHQPGSAIYGSGSGGCNGYVEYGVGVTMAWHVYDACAVWMAFYGDEGPTSIKRLINLSPGYGSLGSETAPVRLLADAWGLPTQEALARYAAKSLTGTGLTWGAADGSSAPLDWGVHMNRWRPPALARGGSVSADVDAAAIMGAVFHEPGTIGVSGVSGVRLFRVSPDGGLTPIADGDVVTPHIDCEGATGDAVICRSTGSWIVAVTPDRRGGTVRLTLD